MATRNPIIAGPSAPVERRFEFGLVTAMLLPGCLAAEVARPRRGDGRSRVDAALDRARNGAALAFSLPG